MPNLTLYSSDIGRFIVADLALLPTCTLRKMSTDDGMFNYIEGKAYIGKPYKYSPQSREVITILNKPTGREFQAEIVLVYDPAGYFAMMPTECLDFPNDPNETKIPTG
jgi:hypothetical protein